MGMGVYRQFVSGVGLNGNGEETVTSAQRQESELARMSEDAT